MSVKLTKTQNDLLRDLAPYAGPANVWSITDARAYRGLAPAYVRILKPVGNYRGTEAIPYFSVRLTAAGRAALQPQKGERS